MTDQLRLPDPAANVAGPVHAAGPDTSAGASLSVAPRSGTWRMKVLSAIALSRDRGLTDWELHRVLGGNLYTIAPRRTELRDGGWIEDSGERRHTNNGVPAIAWVLTPEGRREYPTLRWREQRGRRVSRL